MISTTAYDPGLLSSFVFFDGNGILADVLEPNEFEGAVTLAMDTFSLDMPLVDAHLDSD
jgi:hypothetical protein